MAGGRGRLTSVNAGTARPAYDERVRAVQLQGLERRDGVRFRDEAVRLQAGRTLSHRLRDSRRPAGELSATRWSYRWNPQMFAATATASCSSISTARPATARRSRIRSATTGAASRSRTCRRAWPRRSRSIPGSTAARRLRARRLVRRVHGQLDRRDTGPTRFSCLVNHDGIFDQRMMYYSTEELWFPEWENGGAVLRRAAGAREVQPGELRQPSGARPCS